MRLGKEENVRSSNAYSNKDTMGGDLTLYPGTWICFFTVAKKVSSKKKGKKLISKTHLEKGPVISISLIIEIY